MSDLPRFSVGSRARMGGVRKDLVEAIQAGTEWLPPGYRVVVTSGSRVKTPDSRTKSSRHFTGNAVDVQIIDPQGNLIPNEGPFGGGEMYRQLAHGVYNETLRRNPDLAPQLQWGGEFETVAGSGVSDYMHFDYGGRRSRPSWRRDDWAIANPERATQVAAAAPAPNPPAPAPVSAPAPVPPPAGTAGTPRPPAMTPPLDVGDRSTWPQTWNIPPQLAGPVPLVPPQPPVPVTPLAGTATPATAPAPQATTPALPQPLPPPPFTPAPGGSGFSSGLRPPPSAANFLAPPVYAQPEEPGLASGLTPKSISDATYGAYIPTSYQPFPDLDPNLYSGGAVPRAVAQQRTDDTRPGGPTSISQPSTGEAGGPSSSGDEIWKPPDQMTTQQMIRLVAGMAAGTLRGVKIDYDPFAIQKAGRASTEFPKSALDYQTVGRLTPSKAPVAGQTVGGIPMPQRAEAAMASMPLIYRLMAMGKAGGNPVQ